MNGYTYIKLYFGNNTLVHMYNDNLYDVYIIT